MVKAYKIFLISVLLASLVGISCSAAQQAAAQNNATGIANMTGNTEMAGQLQNDLTNQNDPHAATLVGSESVTTLSDTDEDFVPEIGLEVVADGLTAPMVAVSPDDGTGRLFIVDQTGLVWILDSNGTLLDQPFLDVRDKMVTLGRGYDERGLLGIAFHPDFENNGRVFAFYSAPLRDNAPEGWNCTNRVSQFNVSDDNPNVADTGSEKILMEIDKPQMNHNGGLIAFGPDGYLYIPTGDGGGANDNGTGHTPGIGNAQDMTKVLGKILRIDVDSTTEGKAYGIPEDNPFLDNSSIPPEIYAYGLRNPAFISFDRATGALFVGSAGQELFEPVYIVVRGGNYGWRIREATHCFDPDNPRVPPRSCATTGSDGKPLIGPIVELGHDVGEVVVGGYVYRGDAIPELQGRYIFGDWSGDESANRTLLVATPPSGFNWNMTSADNLTQSDVRMWDITVLRVPENPGQGVGSIVRGFGEDADGEVYIMASNQSGPSGTTGRVLKIVPLNTTAS